MGGDGVYYSDIRGENGWFVLIKINVINVIGVGDVMMVGFVLCWVDGMLFVEFVCFV